MKVALLTSSVAAILLAGTLKFLSFFHFVKWKPITFIKKSYLFSESSVITQWSIFILLLFICIIILYITTQFLYFIPVSFTSITFGLIIAILVEWKIFELPAELASFKKLSIPFIVIVIGYCRFIVETAVFHKQMKNLGSGNKLPYKTSMVK